MRKREGLKFTAAAAAVALIPFGVSRIMSNPPDVSKIMAAAITFTANSAFSTEISQFGNGNVILYKPNPPQTESENNVGQTKDNSSTEPNNNSDNNINSDNDNTQPPASSYSSPKEPKITEAVPKITQPLPEITQPLSQNTEESNEKSYIITQNICDDDENLFAYSGKDLKVIKTTYKANGGANFIPLDMGGYVRNCTQLDNDYVRSETEIPTEIKLKAYSDQPQVLIMHTHTCESYLVGEGDYQDQTYTCRTTDSSQSVVAVGQRMSEKLAEKGICVIHDGTMHDNPAFNGAYARAEETIKAILEKYPSIKVVLDVHRDGIVENDGTPVAAVNKINGKEAAQVMIISAASDGYYYVPNYLQNFHFACLLQQHMESANPGITRPVLFQYCNYNQHLTTGSLLLEIGSQGNTLEQALYTGELIGESIGDALLSLC